MGGCGCSTAGARLGVASQTTRCYTAGTGGRRARPLLAGSQQHRGRLRGRGAGLSESTPGAALAPCSWACSWRAWRLPIDRRARYSWTLEPCGGTADRTRRSHKSRPGDRLLRGPLWRWPLPASVRGLARAAWRISFSASSASSAMLGHLAMRSVDRHFGARRLRVRVCERTPKS